MLSKILKLDIYKRAWELMATAPKFKRYYRVSWKNGVVKISIQKYNTCLETSFIWEY